jgi:biotin carboxyl carrier protein
MHRREAPRPDASPADGAAASGPSSGEHHDEAGAAKSPDMVRIDPAMLRDLHITTAKVETRPGAGSAPVPAELVVPEDAYAEVGSPVAARAMRVSVTAGQQVKREQVLAELQSLELGRVAARSPRRRPGSTWRAATRAQTRPGRGTIAPLREVQEAEAELRSAEASLASARAAPRRWAPRPRRGRAVAAPLAPRGHGHREAPGTRSSGGTLADPLPHRLALDVVAGGACARA